MTTVTIHQPNYLPWIPFFTKIYNSDIFIIYDNAQYKKNEFMNRNKIKTPIGQTYLTIPIKSKESYLKPINLVKLPSNSNWKRKHIASITANYSKSPFFNVFFPIISKIIKKDFVNICELNYNLIMSVIDYLEIKTKVLLSSELNIDTNKDASEKLVEMVGFVGGKKYLSGSYGKDYINQEIFFKNDIEILFMDNEFKHYNQQWVGFIEGLSILDAIFNIGKETLNILEI